MSDIKLKSVLKNLPEIAKDSATSDIKSILRSLPESAGVYRYYDSSETLLYVGKAKNLKKRVNSYFTKEQVGKVRVLVSKIRRIETIVVDNEYEALLLENSLIKQYKPRYNIMLKDDKTYPWLCLTSEHFPRIFPTRRKVNNGGTYFGPYASVRTMNTLLDLLHELYPVRNCRFLLSPEIVASRKVKLCLQYQMKRCKGACQGLQSEEEYLADIAKVRGLVRGRIKPLLASLQEEMERFAAQRQFVAAQNVKERIELLQQYQSKSLVASETLTDLDVVTYIYKDDLYYFNFLHINDGRIIQAQTVEIKPHLDETANEILSMMIVEFRSRYESNAGEVVASEIPDTALQGFSVTVPKAGEKLRLLELSRRNILSYISEKSKRADLVDPDRHGKRIVAEVARALGMSVLPTHIECFDNSNFQGDYAVAAMTVSKNGKLSKKDYRHFNIKTVEGADDFASMEEVLYRRYSRLLAEDSELPQLIIVDGGKGQLSAAHKSISALDLQDKIFLIGIAERLEEIFKVGDPYPLMLDKRSEALKHIQQLRDEAHRFGITHYRKKHLKGLVRTSLTDIKGIGAETAALLLKHFGSVKRVREASFEDLEAVVGKSKAKIIRDGFSGN
ncbi:MAG: excinuclease ABC subunit UvrC [Bacteroidales bacterium]|jgi:excinuclease ABC subunit C|nr:excinuclease ABC subunit UvrC [Bacteroidales bacterium]